MSSLSWLLSLSLRRKLLLFSALIAALPLLFAGQSLIRIARDEMKSSANERLVTTVREVTGQIDDIYERAWLAPLLLIRSAVDSEQASVGEKVAILTHGIAQLPDIVALQITLDGGRLPLVISQNRFSTTLTEAGIQPLDVLRVPPEVILAAVPGCGDGGAGHRRRLRAEDRFLARDRGPPARQPVQRGALGALGADRSRAGSGTSSPASRSARSARSPRSTRRGGSCSTPSWTRRAASSS